MNENDLNAENALLRSALHDANAARDAAIQRVKELEKYEPRIRSMHFEGSTAEVEIENSEAMHFLAEICVKILADAPNFKTAEVELRSTGEWFNVSVERVKGKSIAAALSELRAKVDRARELAASWLDTGLDPDEDSNEIHVRHCARIELLDAIGEA